MPELNQKENKQLTAISLFSGAGGDTLGMKNAGYNVVGFVECNEDAIKTHQLNFSNSVLIGNDIKNIPNSDFEKYKNNIDILFGGFPCQSYSRGGKKRLMIQEVSCIKNLYEQLISSNLNIIAENVKGILSRKTEDKKSLILDKILSDFKDIGYSFSYKIISCEKFGLPQIRKRVIFIAARDFIFDKNDIIDTKNCEMKSIRSFVNLIYIMLLK